MSAGYRIHPRSNVVLFEGKGPMAFAEWSACLSAAMADAAYQPGMRMLSDRRSLEGGYETTTIEQIVLFFRSHARRLGSTRWAVLTRAYDADYGMVRMAGMLSESTMVQVRAFTDLDEALEWILQVVDDEEFAELRAWVDG
jgi:hypothetical protein